MNIIYYNFDYIFLNDLLSLKMELRNSKLSVYENVLSYFLGYGVVDRIGNLPKGMNTIKLSNIPSKVDTNFSFEELINDSISKLKASKQFIDNKPLILFFDASTSSKIVIKALLDNDIKFNLIVSNKDKENSFLYNIEKENIIISDRTNLGSYSKTHYFISHSLGDIINGSRSIFKFDGLVNNLSELNDDKSLFIDYLKSICPTDNLFQDLELQLEEILKLSPVEIKTSYSAIKWIEFYLGYQNIMFDKLTDNMNLKKGFENTFHFFNTDKFQRYCINNISEDYNEEKIKALLYINEETYKTSNIQLDTDIVCIREDFRQFRDIGKFIS